MGCSTIHKHKNSEEISIDVPLIQRDLWDFVPQSEASKPLQMGEYGPDVGDESEQKSYRQWKMKPFCRDEIPCES